MSQDGYVQISQEDIQRLSPNDLRDFQNFVDAKNQEANVQRTIHEFTETCFKKCIRGSISSSHLTSKEDSCMRNCVDRFMDSNLAVLKHLEMMRAQQ